MRLVLERFLEAFEDAGAAVGIGVVAQFDADEGDLGRDGEHIGRFARAVAARIGAAAGGRGREHHRRREVVTHEKWMRVVEPGVDRRHIELGRHVGEHIEVEVVDQRRARLDRRIGQVDMRPLDVGIVDQVGDLLVRIPWRALGRVIHARRRVAQRLVECEGGQRGAEHALEQGGGAAHRDRHAALARDHETVAAQRLDRRFHFPGQRFEAGDAGRGQARRDLGRADPGAALEGDGDAQDGIGRRRGVEGGMAVAEFEWLHGGTWTMTR